MIEFPKIILASASPRRAEILRMVGWQFETLPAEIDESRLAGEGAVIYVERVARAKAEAAARSISDGTVVGADTIVVVDDEILGKPRDDSDAWRMLRLLSGRWHRVLTGIAVIQEKTSATRVAHQMTEVRFASMSEDEIGWYIATLEPSDKAGAYAIQGKGARFIEQIKGEYFNVMGLPVRLLYQLLNESGRLA